MRKEWLENSEKIGREIRDPIKGMADGKGPGGMRGKVTRAL